MTVRCAWAGTDPLYLAYHDEEWGVPVHDDRKLFEMLILEGAQAGLSWITILRQPRGVSGGVRRLRSGHGGRATAMRRSRRCCKTRHRAQPPEDRSAVRNARAFLDDPARVRQLRRLRLGLCGREAARERLEVMGEVPATTPESDALSKDLKKRGFTFVGSTIIYAFMQATGHGQRPHRRLLPLRQRAAEPSRGTLTHLDLADVGQPSGARSLASGSREARLEPSTSRAARRSGCAAAACPGSARPRATSGRRALAVRAPQRSASTRSPSRRNQAHARLKVARL